MIKPTSLLQYILILALLLPAAAMAAATEPNKNNNANEQKPVTGGKIIVKTDGQKNFSSCNTGEGAQPGLFTVEAEGYARDYAGTKIRLYVFNSDNRVVFYTPVNVAKNGKYTLSIPAYKYPPDDYSFGVLPADSDNYIAYGYFVIARTIR